MVKLISSTVDASGHTGIIVAYESGSCALSDGWTRHSGIIPRFIFSDDAHEMVDPHFHPAGAHYALFEVNGCQMVCIPTVGKLSGGKFEARRSLGK